MKPLTLLFFTLCYICNLTVLSAQEPKDSIDNYNSVSGLISSYYNEDFKPFKKGNFYSGLRFSLSNSDKEEENLLVYNLVKGTSDEFVVHGQVAYFFNDLLMAGITVDYQTKEFQGELQSISSDEIFKRQTKSKLTSFIPSITAYYPLSRNQRLSLFTQLGIGFGFGDTVQRDTQANGDIIRNRSEDFAFSAGISPGLTFFVISNVAFEVQLNNLIGYTYEQSNRISDETGESISSKSEVNFEIDLFSLRMGISYYFGTKKHLK